MEKCYFDGAEITKVKEKFYVIGYKDKEKIKKFISKKFKIKEFRCTWIEIEDVKISRGWRYQPLKII